MWGEHSNQVSGGVCAGKALEFGIVWSRFSRLRLRRQSSSARHRPALLLQVAAASWTLWGRSGPCCSIKRSVWLQMMRSGVKWDERSWSDCSWAKPVIMPLVLASSTAPAGGGAEGWRDSAEQRKKNTRSETPVPSFRKKWKLVLLPGRVPLFWCFYSNNFHVPVLPACRVGITQHGKKQKMSETIWLSANTHLCCKLRIMLAKRGQGDHKSSPKFTCVHATHFGTLVSICGVIVVVGDGGMFSLSKRQTETKKHHQKTTTSIFYSLPKYLSLFPLSQIVTY